MSDTAPAPTDPPLGHYLNLPVVGATIQITNTGSGLDKGLAMPAVALDPGTYDVVLRCRLVEHRHEVDDETDTVQLVNRLKAEHATIVDAGEIASEALDRAEQRVAERKSEAERRKREEAGEVPLFDDDGPGLTVVGDVLDDAIGLADDADVDAAWREQRRSELAGWARELLATELTDEHGIDPPTSATKSELVELTLDAEAANRSDSVPF